MYNIIEVLDERLIAYSAAVVDSLCRLRMCLRVCVRVCVCVFWGLGCLLGMRKRQEHVALIARLYFTVGAKCERKYIQI